MRVTTLFFLVFLISIPSTLADLSAGQSYALRFIDVDGNTLSTSDGHVTVLVLTTRADLPKAQAVGDRIPDFCLGNAAYRMITLVKFGQHSAPVTNFMTRMARRRLDSEARQLQARYAAKKIEKDARRDVFAVTDFDGVSSAQLGDESSSFRVFVFGRDGELLRQWDDVPSADDLAAVLMK